MKIKKRWYALFTAPLMIVFFIIMVVPFITGIGYSFVSWDGLAKSEKIFVGFDNYVKLFSDTQFLTCACIRAARDNEAESKEYSADNVVSSVSDRRSDSRVYLAVCIRRGDDFLERDDRNGESVF